MKIASEFKVRLRRLLVGLGVLLILSLLLDNFFFTGVRFSAVWRFGTGGMFLLLGTILPAISGRHLRMYGRSNHQSLPRGVTDRLVTTGIYANLRHPAFEGFWLLTFGLGLLINSPAFVFLAAPVADAYIFYFALVREEKDAFDKFGCEYEEYRRKVPAFWPPFLFRWTMRPKLDREQLNE